MTFFPLFPTSDVAAPVFVNANIRIPSFSMDACQNILHIAGGSFADVYSCTHGGQKHVLKTLHCVEDDADGEQSLFMKEVVLHDRLRGHQNIVEIAAYCYPERALLMEFVSFSVECINLKAQPVFSLDKLLKVLLPGEFVGCTHLALNIAVDVATGLQFMHSRGVVHMDLTPSNVLVSNSHYANLDESDVKKWWLVKPIVCKLTDFGESRSVKTTLRMTNTPSRNRFCGLPVYQAPELYIGSEAGITLDEYKQMDIWSYAMILFDLMNPHAYPYKEEISELPAVHNAHLYLEVKHKNKVLPRFSDRFRELHQSVWQPLRKVYDSCGVHLPTKRPSAKEIVIRLTNEHVEVQSLPVSESIGCEKLSKRRRQHLEDHSSTRNACTFLDIIIADRLLKRVSGPVTKDVIIGICSDAITNFPEEVNSSRDLNEFYGINEAYDIVRSCEACDAYNIHLKVFSPGAKKKSAAMDDLKEALSDLVLGGKPFAVLYVVPPNTVLLCSLTPMTLFVVDTNAVPKLHNGNEENGAVVTSMHGETAVIAIVNWLFSRLCDGKSVHQELGILQPSNVVDVGRLVDNNSIEPTYTSVKTHRDRLVREVLPSGTTVCNTSTATLDLPYNSNQVNVNIDSVEFESCNSTCTAATVTTDEAIHAITNTSFFSPTHQNVTQPVNNYVNETMGRMASELQPSVSSINSIADHGSDLSNNMNQVNVNADSVALDMFCYSTCTAVNATVSRTTFKESDHRYKPDTCKVPHSMMKSFADDCPNKLDSYVSDVIRTSMHSSGLSGGNNKLMCANVAQSVRAEKVKAHYSTVYSRIDTWENCQNQYVENLPADIDGLQKYVIKCNIGEMMAVTKDSRPWNTWVTTSRRGFSGRRRMAKCRGSFACVSDTCSFLVAHKCSNKVQFRERDGQMVCFSCNSTAEFVSCPAVKIWEYHIDLHAVVVYHHGRHTCVTTAERLSSSLLVNDIKHCSRMPAVQILQNELIGCLRKNDVNIEDLEKVRGDIESLRQIRQSQQLTHQEDDPCGESGYDDTISFKKKKSRMDKLVMYDINGKSLNKKSANVFKSSKVKSQLAEEINVEGTGVLTEKVAYVGVKHDKNYSVSPRHRNITHPVNCYDDEHIRRIVWELQPSATSINSIAGHGLDMSNNWNQVIANADSVALDMTCHSTSTAVNATVRRPPFKESDHRYKPDTRLVPHSVIKSLAGDCPNQLDSYVSDVIRTSMHSSGLSGGNNKLRADVALSISAEKVKAHFSTVYSRIETWENCQDQYVEYLPADIDGLQKYVIKCNIGEMMAVTKDSRPWNTWVTTSRRGFSGRRRMVKCRGSFACVSDTCSFLVAHKCSNKVQFREREGQMVCFSCNSTAEYVPCPAVKIWEYHIDLHAVVVYHHGRHTCVTTAERLSSSVFVPSSGIIHGSCSRSNKKNETGKCDESSVKETKTCTQTMF